MELLEDTAKRSFIKKPSRSQRAQLWYCYAQAARRSGNLEKERRGLERVLQNSPDHVAAMLCLAKNAMDRAEYEDAKKWAEQSLRFHRRSSRAHRILSLVSAKKERTAAASKHHQRAVELGYIGHPPKAIR